MTRLKSSTAALAATVAAAALCTTPASALDYSYRIAGKSNDVLVVDAAGLFDPDEAEIYNAWLAHLPDPAKQLPKIAFVFNSRGGSVKGAIEVGAYIQEHQANTGVMAGGACVSACVIAWAAGAHKSATPDALIGIHQASETKMQQGGHTYEVADPSVSGMMANWLASTGAPQSVITKLNSTPPSSVSWLTLDELQQWNVHITY